MSNEPTTVPVEDQNTPTPTPVVEPDFTQPTDPVVEGDAGSEQPPVDPTPPTVDPVNDETPAPDEGTVSPEEGAEGAQVANETDPEDVTPTEPAIEPFSPHEDRLVDEDDESDVCVACQGKGLDLGDYSKLCEECDGSGKKPKKKNKKK